MKQLVIGVLLTALLSLGYRLIGSFNADAADTPAPPPTEQQQAPEAINPIQPAAVRVDTSTPDRTGVREKASMKTQAIARSAAKPNLGESEEALGEARKGPSAPPPAPLMIGPDGFVFRKVGPTPSEVSMARVTPPPADEPLVNIVPVEPEVEALPVVRNDKPLSPEQTAPPAPLATPARGRMIGPDGIEFVPSNRLP